VQVGTLVLLQLHLRIAPAQYNQVFAGGRARQVIYVTGFSWCFAYITSNIVAGGCDPYHNHTLTMTFFKEG